jgi:hypothetical protein
VNKNEVIQLIITIATTVIASIGGAGIIILGLSSWLGKIWADRLYLRTNAQYAKEIEGIKSQYAQQIEEVKSRYSVELERLRADIAQRRDFFNSSMGALSSGYISSHERILTAIEALWNKTLEIRQFTSNFFFFYSILLPSEYSSLASGKIKNVLPDMTPAEFDEKVVQTVQSIDNIRPFLGEKLWQLYRIYQAFSIRSALKIVKRKQQDTLYQWDKDFDGKRDTAMYEMLKEIFTDDELETLIKSSQPFAPLPNILSAIEFKIATEMNEWIFGRQLVKMSIEEQQRIEKLLNSTSTVEETA